jgi:hypothetical protein
MNAISKMIVPNMTRNIQTATSAQQWIYQQLWGANSAKRLGAACACLIMYGLILFPSSTFMDTAFAIFVRNLSILMLVFFGVAALRMYSFFSQQHLFRWRQYQKPLWVALLLHYLVWVLVPSGLSFVWHGDSTAFLVVTLFWVSAVLCASFLQTSSWLTSRQDPNNGSGSFFFLPALFASGLVLWLIAFAKVHASIFSALAILMSALLIYRLYILGRPKCIKVSKNKQQELYRPINSLKIRLKFFLATRWYGQSRQLLVQMPMCVFGVIYVFFFPTTTNMSLILPLSWAYPFIYMLSQGSRLFWPNLWLSAVVNRRVLWRKDEQAYWVMQLVFLACCFVVVFLKKFNVSIFMQQFIILLLLLTAFNRYMAMACRWFGLNHLEKNDLTDSVLPLIVTLAWIIINGGFWWLLPAWIPFQLLMNLLVTLSIRHFAKQKFQQLDLGAIRRLRR